jgi:F0F1-type ATP synthase assembly protein I
MLDPIGGAFLGMLLDQIWKLGPETFITRCLLSTIAAFYMLYRPYWKRARLAGELKPAIVQRVREEARRHGNTQ